MKKTKGLSLLGVLVVLLAGASNTSAAVVSGLSNLLIDGNYYNATFHPGISFKDIWDFDGDLEFGEGDNSLIDRPPMFWENESAAEKATKAIIVALGDSDETIPGWDGHMTPCGPHSTDWIKKYMDIQRDPTIDQLGQGGIRNDAISPGIVWVSYELVAPVPLPAAVWLFGSALMGVSVIARRRKESSDSA